MIFENFDHPVMSKTEFSLQKGQYLLVKEIRDSGFASGTVYGEGVKPREDGTVEEDDVEADKSEFF